MYFEDQRLRSVPFDDQSGIDWWKNFIPEADVNDGASDRYDGADRQRWIDGSPVRRIRVLDGMDAI
jgi:hypothetical protein